MNETKRKAEATAQKTRKKKKGIGVIYFMAKILKIFQ